MIIQFNQIPPEYLSRDSLYKYLNPPDSIIWLEAGIYYMDTERKEVLFNSDGKETISLPPFTSYNTYISVYFNSFLSNSYIVYKTKSNNIRYIDKVEEIPKFIGTIDNLGEALFLVSLYGYEPYKDLSTYRNSNNVYELNLFKIMSPPDSFGVELDDKGKPVDRIPNLTRIKVCTNGDIYEFGDDENAYRKLEVKDMQRPI